MSGHVRARSQTTPAVHRLCIGHAPRQPEDSRAPPRACIEEKQRVSICLLTQLPRRRLGRIIDDAARICGHLHACSMDGWVSSASPASPASRAVSRKRGKASVNSTQYGVQICMCLVMTLRSSSSFLLLTSDAHLHDLDERYSPAHASPCRHRPPAVSFLPQRRSC